MAHLIGAALSDRERRQRLHRARTRLYWLATEVLGYDRLTETFHKPMMDEMDRARVSYVRAVASGRPAKRELDLWARDHYKTTVQIARLCQDYLCDPAWTATWWHAVVEKAIEAGEEVARHFLKNDAFRRLLPEIMPAKNAKKFLRVSPQAAGFRLRSCTDKADSLRMTGAGSEETGGHSVLGVFDDIIGENDVEDSLMPKKRRWFDRTATNVVRTDVGWFRVTGTHWDVDDIYHDWRKAKGWSVRVRACYEKDGVPDWQGEPVLYTRPQIEAKRTGMSRFHFSCQMMNDPLPEADRIWSRDACEHFCTVAEAERGPGRYFVLSDPAPRDIGSASGVKERERQDGTKDWWSTAVVRIRVIGLRQQIVLVDGIHSQDWHTSQGLDEVCRMALRWRTNLVYVEAYAGLAKDYSQDLKAAALRNGVPIYLERDGAMLKFSDSYASGAKNKRFEGLCDWARRGDLLISESTPKSFLYGDEDKTGFLTQIRAWRALLKTNRNNLKYDDDADAVSRATDAALQRFAPRPNQRQVEAQPWSPFRAPEADDASYGSRWIRW